MKCIVNTCQLEHHAKGYCMNHYIRFNKYGDIVLRRKLNGSGTITSNGYKKVYFNGEQQFEHRVVMQIHLKRQLLESEIVHHINGNKLDNRIKNLVITTRPEHAKQHYIEDPSKQTQFKSIAHLGRISPHKGRGGYGKPQEPRPKPSLEGLTWNNHKKRQGYIVRKCSVCHKLRWSRKCKQGIRFCRPCSAENARDIYSNQSWLRKSKSNLPLSLLQIQKDKLLAFSKSHPNASGQ